MKGICKMRSAGKSTAVALALAGALACGGVMGVAALDAATPVDLGVTQQAQAEGYTRDGSMLTNGKTAYYVVTGYGQSAASLYKKDLKTGTVKRVKRLSQKDGAYWTAGAVYKGRVYLNMHNEEKWTKAVYSVKTAGGKLKKVAGKFEITAASGRYAVGHSEYRTDTAAVKAWACKLVGGKLKKVRKLKGYVNVPIFIGGKLYYSSSPSSSMGVVSLYRAKTNGASPKKIGGPWKGKKYSWGGRRQVMVTDITPTSCTVYKNGTRYTYTYKTKKLG